MKKIFLFLLLMFLSTPVFSDNRISRTTTTYNATSQSTTTVKLGDARVYYTGFVASAAGGFFVILDAATNTTSTDSFTDIKVEGKEATSLNSQFRDYSDTPLEFSTGLIVIVQNGTLQLTYD